MRNRHTYIEKPGRKTISNRFIPIDRQRQNGQIDRVTHTDSNTHTKNRQQDRQTEGHLDTQKNRKIDRHTDRLTDKDKKTTIQTEKQKQTHKENSTDKHKSEGQTSR